MFTNNAPGRVLWERIRMNATEKTRRLIQGSENINKMRQEIDVLIGTLTGLILKNITFYETSFQIPTPLGYWKIEKKGKEVTFNCWIKLCHPGDLLGYDSRSQLEIHMKAVESVYTSLPPLVEGLFKVLDGLEEDCQSLVSASYVFEKTVAS
ncbi:MAG: hypothetical protein WCS89_03525 [Candidatus Paceibacterota bacterium]